MRKGGLWRKGHNHKKDFISRMCFPYGRVRCLEAIFFHIPVRGPDTSDKLYLAKAYGRTLSRRSQLKAVSHRSV